MDFYSNFVRLCNGINKKPSKVASEIGISKSIISRWSNGGGISNSSAQKIADYFGISVDDLMGPQKISPVQSDSGVLSPEAYQVALAFDRADEKSRAMVRLALGLDDDMAIAARGGKVVKKPSPVSAETLDELSRATEEAAKKENDNY